jgi:hypothetical protein
MKVTGLQRTYKGRRWLPASTIQDMEGFGKILRKVLSRLVEDHALIFREKGFNRYVQLINRTGDSCHSMTA